MKALDSKMNPSWCCTPILSCVECNSVQFAPTDRRIIQWAEENK